jgi:glycerate 2-kinase
MPLKILIAPAGFKESLSAFEAADAIERGVLRVVANAEIRKLPLSDGGEGFARTLMSLKGGRLIELNVRGPLGKPVSAHYGLLTGNEGTIAAIDSASAAGLRHVPIESRNPLVTTSFGIGELIRAALDSNASRVMVGCGDTATNDAGAGIAQALGVRLLDRAGKDLGPGGAELIDLRTIDISGLEPRLNHAKLELVCSLAPVPGAPLGGSILEASTRRFAPQKGATPEGISILAESLNHFAEVISTQLGIDIRTTPGAGACGGLGAGMHALLGATLRARADILSEFVHLEDRLQGVNLVITGEGQIDSQTRRDKLPALVAAEAKRLGIPVIALAGTVGEGAEATLQDGIDAYQSILQFPCSLREAFAAASTLLERGAENALRLILIGQELAQES